MKGMISFHPSSSLKQKRASLFLIVLFSFFLLVLIISLFKNYYFKPPADKLFKGKVVEINISPLNLQKLDEGHRKSLEEGPRSFYKTLLVPGEIKIDNGEKKFVKIRFKGTGEIHQITEKRSMRVSFSKKEGAHFYSRIDLEHPASQYYQLDKIFRDHLEAERILKTEMEFVSVMINGDPLGLMAMINMVDPSKWGKPNGVLLRSGNWIPRQEYNNRIAKSNWRARSAIPIFSHAGEEVKNRAIARLRGWQYNHLKASDVFDIEQSARYLAIAELWGAWHAGEIEDIYFYFNPSTSKFELVAADPATQMYQYFYKGILHTILKCPDTYPAKSLLDDHLIKEAFLKHLRRITSTQYINKLQDFVQEKNMSYISILGEEFSNLPDSPAWLLSARASFLRQLSDEELFSEKIVDIPHNKHRDYKEGLAKYTFKATRESSKIGGSSLSAEYFQRKDTGSMYLVVHNAIADIGVINECNYNKDIFIQELSIQSSGSEQEILNQGRILKVGKPIYIPLESPNIVPFVKLRLKALIHLPNKKKETVYLNVYPGVEPEGAFDS